MLVNPTVLTILMSQQLNGHCLDRWRLGSEVHINVKLLSGANVRHNIYKAERLKLSGGWAAGVGSAH